MGLEEVTQEIVEDAESRAEAILSEAEEKKEAILDEARKEADAILEEAEEAARNEAEALRKKEISSARMDAQEKKLQAREEVLEEVFERFRERLEDLDEETERELVEETLERLQGEVDIGTVRARDGLEDLASEYGDFEAADTRGVVVETADGNRRFDLTFDTTAEKTIAEARKEVSEVLFD